MMRNAHIGRTAALLMAAAMLLSGSGALGETTALMAAGRDGIEYNIGIFSAAYAEGRAYFNRGFDICVSAMDGSAPICYDTANYEFNDDTEAYLRFHDDTELYPITLYERSCLISGLAGDGDTLWAVRIAEEKNDGDEQTGHMYVNRGGTGAALCRVTADGDDLNMQTAYALEWEGMEVSPVMSSCAVSGDELYMRPDDLYIPEGGAPHFIYFKLAEGETCEGETVEVPGLVDVFCGKNGEIWCSILEDGALKVRTLTSDGAGDEIAAFEDAKGYGEFHAVYSPYDGRIYAVDCDSVRYIGENGESGEYSLPLSRACGAAPAEGGLIVYTDDKGIFTDGENGQETKITIIGSSFNNVLAEDYMLSHPGIKVEYRYMDEVSDISTAILTKNTDAELFFFSSNDGSIVRSIIDRGYAAEISSEYLNSQAARLYPALRDYVSRDGRVYGACVDVVSQSPFVADEYILDEARIQRDALPASWPELFDYVDSWGENPSSWYYRLFDDGDTPEAIKRLMLGYLHSYYSVYLRSGMVESFDTPEFRALLKRLNEVDFSAAATFEDYYYPVIQICTPIGCDSGMYGLLPLDLKLSDDIDAIMPMSCSVAMVNPAGENAAEAEAFLEFYLERLDPLTQGNIYTDAPESVRPGDYAGIVHALQEDVAVLTESRDGALEDHKYLYDELIAERKLQIEYYENDYFVYTQESLSQYRELAQRMAIFEPLALNSSEDEAMAKVFDSYIGGTLSDDAFIAELDRRHRMDLLESK
jgi:hypothetical protein